MTKGQRLTRIIRESRCVACKEWCSPDTLAHGSLGGMMCWSQERGRKRTIVLVADVTERQQELITTRYHGHAEYHPMLPWRKATAAEARAAIAKGVT